MLENTIVLLRKRNIEFTQLTPAQIFAHQQDEILPYQQANEARRAFEQVEKNELILVSNWDEYGFQLKHAAALTAGDLDQPHDIIVTEAHFRWTYAKTHELGLGPYFFTNPNAR